MAAFSGLRYKTLWKLDRQLRENGWKWEARPQKRKYCRPLTVRHTAPTRLPPAPGGVPPGPGGVSPAAGNVVSPAPAAGGVLPATGGGRQPGTLPRVVFAAVDKECDVDEMDDIDDIDGPATGGELPAIGGVHLLDQWRQHSNYRAGMHVAEVTTFWITAGLPDYRFEEFMAWATARFPGQFGDVNHSKHWVQEFCTSLTKAVQRNTAASTHALTPALGIPSDITRVIDVVSLSGVSLLPIVEVHTNAEGRLIWSLAGCPALGYQKSAPGVELAPGSDTKTWSRSHSGEKLVSLVRTTEQQMHIGIGERTMRLAMTMADGAIQGPGSADFEKHEATCDGRPCDILRVGMCAFHRVDGGGGHADRAFPITDLYDRFLRLVRKNFAWGAGNKVLRAVATEFGRLADELQTEGERLLRQSVEADVQNRPAASARLAAAGAREQAHALAFHRAGWTKHRRPLAPKADGTRKVVWQTLARRRFFDMFALVFLGTKVRMVETLDSARVMAENRGARVTPNTGMNCKQMKALRAMGRTTCDIRFLVFNISRCDFREKHLVPHALESQATGRAGVQAAAGAINLSQEMFKAIGVLMEMRAIVILLQRLLVAARIVVRAPEAGRLKMYTIWAVARTLLSHRGWRKFPGLTRHLPHIVLAGTMQGVSLQGGDFDEPCKQAKRDPQVAGTLESDHYAQWRGVVARRQERVDHVLRALDSLIEWARGERRHFMQKMFGYAAATRDVSDAVFRSAAGKRRLADVERVELAFDGSVDQASLLRDDDDGDGEDARGVIEGTPVTDGHNVSKKPAKRPKKVLRGRCHRSHGRGIQLHGRCHRSHGRGTRVPGSVQN